MQIRFLAIPVYPDFIAAPVFAVTHVQWLMQIPDKMRKETQCGSLTSFFSLTLCVSR